MKLKGSKTEKNLEAAFAGESRAHARYSFYADEARKEGLGPIAAIFQEAAENEKEHARMELEFLEAIGNTQANLEAAATGEHAEWARMYPEFEQAARQEGFAEIADFFKEVTKIEEEHEKRYRALMENVKAGKVFKRDKVVRWKCPNCGWFHEGVDAPEECPTCKLPRSGFEAGPPIVY